jgi:hypothetical protein
MIDPGELTLDAFADRVGEEFRIRASDEHSLDATLTEATAVGDARTPGGREPFSVIFRGPPEPILPQGTHRIEHDALGAAEIFLVPLAPDAAGARYQAVFA